MNDHITELILGMLADLLDNEPPHDARGHPSMEVHERVGAEWAEWDKKVHGLKLILASRLIPEALAKYREESAFPERPDGPPDVPPPPGTPFA